MLHFHKKFTGSITAHSLIKKLKEKKRKIKIKTNNDLAILPNHDIITIYTLYDR